MERKLGEVTPQVTHDSQAQGVYVGHPDRVATSQKVSKTLPITNGVSLNLDDQGRVLGVKVFGVPPRTLNIGKVRAVLRREYS